MVKISKFQTLRMVVQILFFIFIPGLYIILMNFIKQLVQNISIGNMVYITGTITFGIIILSITLLGRFFCGYMCAFGTYNDFVYKISNKIFNLRKIKVPYELDKYFKYFKYIVLATIIVSVSTSLFTLNGASPWNAFANVFDIKYVLEQCAIGAIILVAITICCIFIERFFCRYLCPLGAMFNILSKLKIIKISKEDTNCGKCRICSNNCPMNIDLNVNGKPDGECIQCFKCVEVCPRSNMKVNIIDSNVNKYVVTALALGSITGSIIAGKNIENSASQNTNTTNNVASENKGTDVLTSQTNTATIGSSTNSISSAAAAKYIDGTYEGVGRGYRPNLTVAVTIKNDKITKIEILSNNETPEFTNTPFSKIPSSIISKQSTSVASVSGATRTSEGIKQAVSAALLKALK